MPEVSVIVPIYKVEKYLNRCVDSILSQTFKDFEIILVDDGSPDKCGEICEAYAKKNNNIKVIHKENGGLSDARNAGLEVAAGKYIVFVDSDDYIDSNMIDILYRRLVDTGADMTICNYLYVDEDETPMPEYNEFLAIEDTTYTGMQVLYGATTKGRIYFVTACNRMYKRELWKDIRFPKGKLFEDDHVFHKLCLKCDLVAGVSKPLYFYRQRYGSIVRTVYTVQHLDDVEALFAQVDAMYEIKEYELAVKFNQIALTLLRKGYRQLDRKDKNNKDKLNSMLKIYRNNVLRLIRFMGAIPDFKGRLRCILGFIDPAWTFNCINYIKTVLILLRYRINIVNKQYILINISEHGNLGDSAISLAEEKCLKDSGSRYTLFSANDVFTRERLLASVTPHSKTILLNGGGSIGCIWKHEEEKIRRLVTGFGAYKVIVFPQTVTFNMKTESGRKYFEESKKIYSANPNLHIFVREKKSLDFIKEQMPTIKTTLVPDIVAYMEAYVSKKERKGVLMCLRSDREKKVDGNIVESIINEINTIYPDEKIEFTDTVINKKVTAKIREREVTNKLDEFASAKLIITDRLHGMLFAAISGTPCIAFGNSNGKVKGVYEWIKDNEYIRYMEDAKAFSNILKDLDLNKKYRYENVNIKKAFEPLLEELKCSSR